MSDYTPTTADVFQRYDWGRDFSPNTRREFDRWLRQVKSQAWNEGVAAAEFAWMEPTGEPQDPYREEQ